MWSSAHHSRSPRAFAGRHQPRNASRSTTGRQSLRPVGDPGIHFVAPRARGVQLQADPGQQPRGGHVHRQPEPGRHLLQIGQDLHYRADRPAPAPPLQHSGNLVVPDLLDHQPHRPRRPAWQRSDVADLAARRQRRQHPRHRAPQCPVVGPADRIRQRRERQGMQAVMRPGRVDELSHHNPRQRTQVGGQIIAPGLYPSVTILRRLVVLNPLTLEIPLPCRIKIPPNLPVQLLLVPLHRQHNPLPLP